VEEKNPDRMWVKTHSDKENWILKDCPEGNGGKSITQYMCHRTGSSPGNCAVDPDSLSAPGEWIERGFPSSLIPVIVFFFTSSK
jgi:hypothetical protein